MSFGIRWGSAQIQGDSHLSCVSFKRKQVKTPNPGDQAPSWKREGIRNWSGDRVGGWQPWMMALLQAPGPWPGRSEMEIMSGLRGLGRQQCVTRGRKAEAVGDGGLAMPMLQCVSKVLKMFQRNLAFVWQCWEVALEVTRSGGQSLHWECLRSGLATVRSQPAYLPTPVFPSPSTSYHTPQGTTSSHSQALGLPRLQDHELDKPVCVL